MEKEKIDKEVMLPEGKTLQGGRYTVKRHLSSGGFGNTYVVYDETFDENMAMKEFFMKGINERDSNNTTVSVSNAANKSQFTNQQEKFKKEAQRLRKLKHKNIVHVDNRFDENGTSYYVMDLINNGSLKNLGKMTEEKLMQLLPHILDALEYVHNQQMWHLDIKPGNILLNDEGEPVLIDFGASKQLGKQNGESTSTAMTYTPGYAPTEQIDQNFERIGPWTDLYALGGTIYNLLTGSTPPAVSDIEEDSDEAFHFPTDMSSRMRKLIVWLMTPNRKKRPQSVAEVREFLSRNEEKSYPPHPHRNPKDDITVIGDSTEDQSEEESRPAWLVKAAVASAVVAALIIAVVVFMPAGEVTPAKQQSVAQNDSFFHTKKAAPTPSAQKQSVRITTDLGTFDYEGTLDAEGQPDGLGEAKFTDGRYYKGPFVKGKMHGQNAVFKYSNGDTFEGSFDNNLFSQGRYTIKDDGSYFVGTFIKGDPAKGSWYDKRGNVIEIVGK